MRERVAAIIERDGLLLMVRQRARGESGRHDGFDYLTLPGGGIEAGESAEDAVAREVREEVGLQVVAATRLRRVEHLAHPGATTLYVVEVAEGPAVLGVDPELACDCPRLVGLTWVDAPTLERWEGDDVRSLLLVRLC